MPYPNLEGKHDHEALITPEQSMEYFDDDPETVPERMVLCFDEGLLDHVTDEYAVTGIEKGHGTCYALDETARTVGIVGEFGVGAPTTAMIIEELRVRGATTFLLVGHAGSLQPDVGLGDLVVVSKALRDEGVSYHYCGPDRYIDASPSLRDRLVTRLADAGDRHCTGPTWTIDTPYRETGPEIAQYREEGLVTVDMEAAAAFAVATHHDLCAGALFTISDHLDPDGWDPQFAETQPHLQRAFAHAVGALQ